MRKFLLAALATLAAGARPPLEPGVYAFYSNQTGQVLDVWGGDKREGAPLSTSQWGQHLNQAFAIQTDNNVDFGIAAFHSLKGLTVTDRNLDVEVTQRGYVSAPSQHWRIIPKPNGLFAIQNQVSGKFLTVGNRAGDKVFQSNDNGQRNQLFRPFKLDHTAHTTIKDGQILTFINRANSLPLEIGGADMRDGGRLSTWDHFGIPNQQFQVVASRSSPEFVRLRAVHSGKVLACNRGGNQIVQEEKRHGDRGQLWRFVQSEDGTYQIENQAARDAITVGRKGESAKHRMIDSNNKHQQFWAMEIL